VPRKKYKEGMPTMAYRKKLNLIRTWY